MAGGYSQRSAGQLLASVQVREDIEAFGGNPDAMGGLVDYRNGWEKLPDWRRDLLWQFIHNQDAPPDIDLERLKARIESERLLGLEPYQLVQTLQEIIALRRFAGELNGKYDRPREPFKVRAGPAHRGPCFFCGALLIDVLVWRDPERNRRWCIEHGSKGVDLPGPRAYSLAR